MAERGEALAQALMAKVAEVIETVTTLSDDQWRLVSTPEGWPIGLVAYHIALGIERQGGWVEEVTRGGEAHRFSWDVTNDLNAAVARSQILPSKRLVLAALSASTERFCDLLRGMTADDLHRDAFIYGDRARSAGSVVDIVSMRHIDDHLANIRATTAPPEARQ